MPAFGGGEIKSGGNRMEVKPGPNKVRLLVSGYTRGEVIWPKITTQDGKEQARMVTVEVPGVDGPKITQQNARRVLLGNGQLLSAYYTPNSRFRTVVWSYAEQRVCILEGPKSIFRDIDAIAANPSWGDPTRYDIVVVKEVGGRTAYRCSPEPPTPFPGDMTALQPEIDRLYAECQFTVPSRQELLAELPGAVFVDDDGELAALEARGAGQLRDDPFVGGGGAGGGANPASGFPGGVNQGNRGTSPGGWGQV